MKRLFLILVVVSVVAGMAAGLDILTTVSGSATLEWGFAGQLLNTTGDFMQDSVPSGDFYSSISDSVKWNAAPKVKLTLSVADEDGTEIVTASTSEVTVAPTSYASDTAIGLAFEYIAFPNVVPGILGVKLNKATTLAPGQNTPAGSTTSNEHFLITVTPIEQLTAVVGLMLKPDNKLTQSVHDIATETAIDSGTFIQDTNYDDTDEAVEIDLDDTAWEVGTYMTYAASIDLGFKQTFGEEDADSIALGVGAVYDIAYFNGVYYPDAETAVDNVFSIYDDQAATLGKALTADAADSAALVTQTYGAISVNALSVEDMYPTEFGGAAADAQMLRTNQVLGRKTIPLGVNLDVVLGGLTAGADFKTRLVEGKDQSSVYPSGSYDVDVTAVSGIPSLMGIVDLADVDNTTYNFVNYAMPMYIMGMAKYAMDIGDDDKLTVDATFKYSSDYWKWGANSDNTGFAYAGDVSAAKYLGRPMSVEGGVSVTGLLDMIDVSLSGSYGFGDGKANHGFGMLSGNYGTTDPVGVGGTADGYYNYTQTFDSTTRVAETVVFDNTMQALLDYWKVMPTLGYASDFNSINTDEEADTASDAMNNRWIPSGVTAMGVDAVVTVKPIENLTIKNTTAYSVDNLGIVGAEFDNNDGADPDALFGSQLSTLTNTTNVSYVIMVGEATAFTIFGEVVYKTLKYETEDGQNYVGLRTTSATVAPDTFEFAESEAIQRTTLGYEAGVSVTISY